MSDFLSNLFEALGVVVQILSSLSFSINQATISLFSILIYGSIITNVIFLLKETSYNGGFTMSKDRKSKISEDRFRERTYK